MRALLPDSNLPVTPFKAAPFRELILAQRAAGVEMPITMATCAVLEGRLTPRAALEALLARDPKREGGEA